MNKAVRAGATSDTATSRPYHHGNLRGAILAAALDFLSRSDPSALSLRDLARTVGVGHSALYSHFRDRSALLAAIAGEGFRALLADLQAASAVKDNQLAALASAYLDFARTRPAYYRTMFLAEVTLPQNIDHVEEPCRACLQTLIQVLENLSAASPEETHERAVAIWSALHGLALLGDNSGPLHSHISQQREPVLATKIVEILANAAWPSG